MDVYSVHHGIKCHSRRSEAWDIAGGGDLVGVKTSLARFMMFRQGADYQRSESTLLKQSSRAKSIYQSGASEDLDDTILSGLFLQTILGHM